MVLYKMHHTSREVSELARNIGFDEFCDYYYWNEEIRPRFYILKPGIKNSSLKFKEISVTAPNHFQLGKFLEEKYKIGIEIIYSWDFFSGKRLNKYIIKNLLLEDGDKDKIINKSGGFEDIWDCEEAALKKACLNIFDYIKID